MAELKIHSSQIRIEDPGEFEESYFREEYTHIFRVIEEIVERTKENRQQERMRGFSNTYSPDIHIHNIVPIIGQRGSGKSTVMLSVAGVLKTGMKNNSGEISPFFKPFCGEGKPLSDKRFILLDCIDGSLLEPNEDIFQTILALMYQHFKSKEEETKRLGGRFEEFEGARDSIQYRWQQISKKFEKLYHHTCLLDQEAARREQREDITPLYSLRQLSSSLKIRQDFRGLLRDCLSLYADTNKNKMYRNAYQEMEEYFLVIPIDDLDLNILHGHEMLEKIHRYLMLPNVIILMAFDQDQLCRLSEKFFYSMIPTFDSKMNDASPKIVELARQYLEKVMPLDARTHIPRFYQRVEATVELYNELSKKDSYNVRTYAQKNLVFYLLCMKLGMRMDTNGVKRHFFLQRSLRSYVNFVLLLNGMSQLSENSVMGDWKSAEFSFRYNERILTQEIINRMVPERLSDSAHTYHYRSDDASTTIVHGTQKLSSRHRFDRIIDTQRPLPRAFKELIRVVQEEAADVGLNVLGRMPGDRSFDIKRLQVSNTYPGRLLDLAEDLNYYGYSYGEVLHTIYEYGRFHAENKELIRCLMAYYSLKLTHSFLYYRYGTREKKKQERINLMDTLGGSVAGGWANRMMPAVYRVYIPRTTAGEDSQQVAVGSASESGCRIDVVLKDVLKLSSLTDVFLETSDRSKLPNKNQLRDIIRSVLLLGMFFDSPNNHSVGSLKWLVKGENPIIKNTREMLKNASVSMNVNRESYIHLAEGVGVFNALGFVTTAFRWGSRLADEKLPDYILSDSIDTGSMNHEKPLEDEPIYLLSRVCEYLKEEFYDETGILDKLLDELALEIVKEFKDWSTLCGGFAIPVHDIDVCYNILKRLSQRWYEEFAGSSGVPHTEILNQYLEAYKTIAQRLMDNDQAYTENCGVEFGKWEECESTSSLLHFQYKDAFCKCPYMKWLNVSTDIGPDEEKADHIHLNNFNKIFAEVIDKLISPGNSKSLRGAGGYVAPTYDQ